MLHDIGKLRVPDHILTKPGPLTADEEAIVRLHTVWGERILADGDGYGIARRVVRWHHENFDGSGYPDGLRYDRIPHEARIVRIADAFDAMTHGRRYQAARDLEWAADELLRCSGQQFDPDLVRVFLDVLSADQSFARAIVSTISAEGERISRVPRVLTPAGEDPRT
jgi:HD-GYP domain-containing protein (c-di-GMP phosphodiesterase class II)